MPSVVETESNRERRHEYCSQTDPTAVCIDFAVVAAARAQWEDMEQCHDPALLQEAVTS